MNHDSNESMWIARKLRDLVERFGIEILDHPEELDKLMKENNDDKER